MNACQGKAWLWLLCHSACNMISKGSTNPSSTGIKHSHSAKAAGQPCRRRGWDSLVLEAVRLETKRKRRCAVCSSHKTAATNTNKTLASCAAAQRLSITNQAL